MKSPPILERMAGWIACGAVAALSMMNSFGAPLVAWEGCEVIGEAGVIRLNLPPDAGKSIVVCVRFSGTAYSNRAPLVSLVGESAELGIAASADDAFTGFWLLHGQSPDFEYASAESQRMAFGDGKAHALVVAYDAKTGVSGFVDGVRVYCNSTLRDSKFQPIGVSIGGLAEPVEGVPNAVGLKVESVEVFGSDLVIHEGRFPSEAEQAGYLDSAWTGTVWLMNLDGSDGCSLSSYGNANSTVRLTGVKGYFPPNVPVLGTVDLEDGAEVAFEQTGGSSGWRADREIVFSHLTGSGTFRSVWSSGTGAPILIRDVSGFDGSLALMAGGTGILIGESVAYNTPGGGKGIICLDAGAEAEIGEGREWRAPNGIFVAGKIGGAGTLLSETRFGDGAAIDLSKGALSAPSGVSFGATLRIVGGVEGGVVLADLSAAPETLPIVLNDKGESGEFILKYAPGGKILLAAVAASVGESSYSTIEEAINANNGEAIVLRRDVEIDLSELDVPSFRIDPESLAEHKIAWCDDGRYLVRGNDNSLVLRIGTPRNGFASFASYVLGLDAEDELSRPTGVIPADNGNGHTLTLYLLGPDGAALSPMSGYALSLIARPTRGEAIEADGACIELPVPEAGESRWSISVGVEGRVVPQAFRRGAPL